MSCSSISSCFGNPNVYAQQYANANGISFSEAKSQLKSKYGDPEPLFNFNSSSSKNGPQKPGDYDPVSHKSKTDGSKNIFASTAPAGASDPESYAKTVCLEKYGDTKEAHMTKVRAELKAKYGNPTNPFASIC